MPWRRTLATLYIFFRSSDPSFCCKLRESVTTSVTVVHMHQRLSGFCATNWNVSFEACSLKRVLDRVNESFRQSFTCHLYFLMKCLDTFSMFYTLLLLSVHAHETHPGKTGRVLVSEYTSHNTTTFWKHDRHDVAVCAFLTWHLSRQRTSYRVVRSLSVPCAVSRYLTHGNVSSDTCSCRRRWLRVYLSIIPHGTLECSVFGTWESSWQTDSILYYSCSQKTSFGRTESDGFESRNLLDKQISDCITGILYLDSSLPFDVETH